MVLTVNLEQFENLKFYSVLRRLRLGFACSRRFYDDFLPRDMLYNENISDLKIKKHLKIISTLRAKFGSETLKSFLVKHFLEDLLTR